MGKEFELIQRYFAGQPMQRSDTVLGIGDDAAIIQPPSEGYELVVTTDILVNGVHFPQDTSPEAIGYKALAVNLSDLAAMGAEPAWVTLGLSLTQPEDSWLQAFCQGFYELAQAHQVQLIGGDITYSPTLSITVQAMGWVPQGQALRRDKAQPGDKIYVTGQLGGAGLALKLYKEQRAIPAILQQRLDKPEPRVKQGMALRQIASSAIDISDGLAADLSHILQASGVGAELWVDQLPLQPELIHYLSYEQAWQLALTHGDDYELCFTLSSAEEAKQAKNNFLRSCTCIGKITKTKRFLLKLADKIMPCPLEGGYQHF